MKETRYLKIFGFCTLIPLEIIYSYFSKFGHVQFARYGDSSPSRPWVVVAFVCVDTATRALQSCADINGIPVSVSFCENTLENCDLSGHVIMDGDYADNPQENGCSLCDECTSKCALEIGGFPSLDSRMVPPASSSDYFLIASAIKRELLAQLEKYANIVSLRLYLDGYSALKVIATFHKCGDCSNFFKNAGIIKLFGNTLSLQRCRADDLENEEEINDIVDVNLMEASRTLYISNIHERTTRDDLRSFFGKYGHIISIDSCRMPLFAFIQYVDIASVVRAVNAGSYESMWGRRLKLNFGKTLRWKTLWLKINGVFNGNDVINHIKRFVKPERFYVDTPSAEMLIWFRRIDDAVSAFKKLRAHQVEDGFFFMVDFSSDKMDKYFFDRSDIDSQSDSYSSRKNDSSKHHEMPPRQTETGHGSVHDWSSVGRSSSICSCESVGNPKISQPIFNVNVSVNDNIMPIDTLVVVDSSSNLNNVTEKAYRIANLIRPSGLVDPAPNLLVDCSSLLLRCVIGCLRRSASQPQLLTDLNIPSMTLQESPIPLRLSDARGDIKPSEPFAACRMPVNGRQFVDKLKDAEDFDKSLKNLKDDCSAISKMLRRNSHEVSDNVSDASSVGKRASAGPHKSINQSEFLEDLFIPDNAPARNGRVIRPAKKGVQKRRTSVESVENEKNCVPFNGESDPKNKKEDVIMETTLEVTDPLGTHICIDDKEVDNPVDISNGYSERLISDKTGDLCGLLASSSKSNSIESESTKPQKTGQDEELVLPKRQKKRHSHVYIDSDEDSHKSKTVFDIYNDIVANAVKDVGISMYDSIKIRRYYSDPNNLPSPVSERPKRKYTVKSRKRKWSSESTQSSTMGVRDLKDESDNFGDQGENPVKPDTTPWRLDLLFNGGEEINSKIKLEEAKMEIEDVKQEIVVPAILESELLNVEVVKTGEMSLTMSNGSSFKKRRNPKVKISTGLSRVLKNNVKFLRNHEAAKIISVPLKDPVHESKEEEAIKELVVNEEEPPVETDSAESVGESAIPLDAQGRSDSESTITVIHPEDRSLSPEAEEYFDCPGPPKKIVTPNLVENIQIPSQFVVPVNSESIKSPNDVKESSTKGVDQYPRVQQIVNPLVYQQPFVYSSIAPINYDPHQFYYQQPFYFSPVELMRSQSGTRFVRPDTVLYSNDFSQQQAANFCLQPVALPQQYIPQQNMPYDYSVMPTNFVPVQYIRQCAPATYRMGKDVGLMPSMFSTIPQGVRLQQPLLSDGSYYVAMSAPNSAYTPAYSANGAQSIAPQQPEQIVTLPSNTFRTPSVRSSSSVVSTVPDTSSPALVEKTLPEDDVKILKGVLMMKNVSVEVEYHYITGVYALAERIMPIKDTTVPVLRMTQRMHLIKSQIDEVEKRLKSVDKWCCFAVTAQNVTHNLSIFRVNFIEYLLLKGAAGIVSYNPSKEKTDELFPVIYFIPPSPFSESLLGRWTGEDNPFRKEKDVFLAIVSDK